MNLAEAKTLGIAFPDRKRRGRGTGWPGSRREWRGAGCTGQAQRRLLRQQAAQG